MGEGESMGLPQSNVMRAHVSKQTVSCTAHTCIPHQHSIDECTEI